MEKVKGQTGFLRSGSIAAILSVALIPIQIIIWQVVPPPETVEGFLQRCTEHPFLGVWSLDLPIVINYGVVLIMYIALYVLLKHKEPLVSLTALVLGCVAVAMPIPSNAGTVGLAMSLVSLLPWAVFAVLVAIRYWKFSTVPGAIET